MPKMSMTPCKSWRTSQTHRNRHENEYSDESNDEEKDLYFFRMKKKPN